MTQFLHPDDPRLRLVTPGQVTQYLMSIGWKRSDSPNDRLLAFEGPNDDTGSPLQLTIPKRVEYRDFYDRVNDAIASLSVILRRPIEQIARQISRINRDALQSRLLPIGSTDLNSIPLSTAAECVNNLRSLISYAATAEYNPKPYFGKASTVGTEFAEECRFAHTFRGSFGFTVETPPLPDPVEPKSHEVILPSFQRRVMERLASGFNAIREGVRTEDVNVVAANYKSGLNANLCEKVIDMSAVGSRTALEFAVSFGGITPSRVDEASESPLVLNDETVEYLSVVAKRLRAIAVPEEKIIRGKIVELRSNLGLTEDDADAEFVVVVLWASEGVRVKMRLSSEQYKIALEAHRAIRDIAVGGLLEKVGKRWILSNPGQLTLPS